MGTYKVEQILPGNSENTIRVDSPPNDKLRWEKTQSVNAGLDFSVLDQAISLGIDYYYRYSSDLIGTKDTFGNRLLFYHCQLGDVEKPRNRVEFDDKKHTYQKFHMVHKFQHRI